MFTLENTARATHVFQHGSKCSFYDASNDRVVYWLPYNTLNWAEYTAPLPMGLLELSRPQSDIQQLFDVAPEWATGYAKINRDKFWTGDDVYNHVDNAEYKKQRYGAHDQESYYLKEHFTIIATRPALDKDVAPSMYTPDQHWLFDNMKEWQERYCDYVVYRGGTKPVMYMVSKPTSFPYITREQWENRQAPTLPARTLHEPKDKPIYTQAMADAGVSPIVGMECLIFYPTNNHKGTITYMGKGVGAFHSEDADIEYTFSLDVVSFKPIDTRTDKEKAIDEFMDEHLKGGIAFKHLISLAYDKWVNNEQY